MKLLKNKSQTPNLKTVVCFHCVSSAVKQMTADADLDVITFEQLEVKQVWQERPTIASNYTAYRICSYNTNVGLFLGSIIYNI